MKLLARVFAAAVTCATVAVPLVAADAPAASAAPTWAPAATAPIHPGVQTFTAGAQCTANFVFYRRSTTVYIGQAAHCSGTGGNTATNGCTSGSLPIGTQVAGRPARRSPARMVYNSWLTMQALGETDANTCQFNDLALIKLNPADFGEGQPVDPVLGRPERHRQQRHGRRARTCTLRELRAARRRQPAEPEAAASASATPAAAGATTCTPRRPGSPATRGARSSTRRCRARRAQHGRDRATRRLERRR